MSQDKIPDVVTISFEEYRARRRNGLGPLEQRFESAPCNHEGSPVLRLLAQGNVFSEAALTLVAPGSVSMTLTIDPHYAGTRPDAPFVEYDRLTAALERNRLAHIQPIMMVDMMGEDHSINLRCAQHHLRKVLDIAGIPTTAEIVPFRARGKLERPGV